MDIVLGFLQNSSTAKVVILAFVLVGMLLIVLSVAPELLKLKLSFVKAAFAGLVGLLFSLGGVAIFIALTFYLPQIPIGTLENLDSLLSVKFRGSSAAGQQIKLGFDLENVAGQEIYVGLDGTNTIFSDGKGHASENPNVEGLAYAYAGSARADLKPLKQGVTYPVTITADIHDFLGSSVQSVIQFLTISEEGTKKTGTFNLPLRMDR